MNQPKFNRRGRAGSLTLRELPAGGWRTLSRRYLLYTPAEDVQRPWPLILFLHGAGERGDDPELVKVHGIPGRLAAGVDLPFLVVAPQCQGGQRWATESLTMLVDEIQRSLPVDIERIYVTGMSMGGGATWALAIDQPDRFSAIAPVCGFGDPNRVCALAHLPVWAFHGARDDAVSPQRSVEMVEALRACGGDVRLTIYPEADHDSWTETYANPDLYAWFLSHRRAQ